MGRAQRVPIEIGQNSGAAAPTVDASLAPATATAEEDDDYAGDYEDEVDQNLRAATSTTTSRSTSGIYSQR